MFAEDLSAFFSSAEFATAATLGGGGSVQVIFDKSYAGSLGGLVESAGPQCVAMSSDVAAIVQGSTITINATVYTVTGVEPDGTGITVLQLRG